MPASSVETKRAFSNSSNAVVVNVFTASNNFISKTAIHRKEKYNTYINANSNGKNNC